MLQELRDYGWDLVVYEPLEYSPSHECMWVSLENKAFPDMHLIVEANFVGAVGGSIIVSDDNIDGAGDSADILTQVINQGEFDPDEIWKACEKVMEKRKERC
jgi:hypothetical protein